MNSAALNATDAAGYREALMGTVGAVALDAERQPGSRDVDGGVTGKRSGRVGDSR